MELSVVLPAYEEAANLRSLLPQLKATLTSLAVPFEILVIDTESPHDETPDVCRENQVRYISRSGGSHYGDAIRTGLRHAGGKYIVCMDADGSHDPDFIRQLWDYRETYDLVIASRYVRGGKTENPFILIFLSLTVNVVFRLVLNLKCYDVSNSFRLYQGDLLRALTLGCSDFDIVEEMLVKLSQTKTAFRIKEVPFTFQKRWAGKTKRNLISFAFGYLGTLHKLHQIKRKTRK